MRLWHIDLIPYLPKSQLLAQKRECDLILKDATLGRRTNHILINYIYEYGGVDSISFKTYYALLYKEFKNRGFRFNDKYQMVNYFYVNEPPVAPFNRHHNNEYLLCNFFNLLEKYRRNQRDFDRTTFENLYNFVNNIIKLDNIGVYNV